MIEFMQMVISVLLLLTSQISFAPPDNAKFNYEELENEADYGTVEEGKIANLLLLNENPLDTVDAWNNIQLVILYGEAIERAVLGAKIMVDE